MFLKISKNLAKSFSSQKEIQRKFGERYRKIQEIITDIRLASNLDELKILQPSLEELKGNRLKTFSIKINKNWRMILQPYWEAENAQSFLKSDGGIDHTVVDCVEITDIEDYH